MKHKLFAFLLAIIASTSMIFAQSGTCGDNLTWNLTNGVLTISGTGAMTDYGQTFSSPWSLYRSAIQYVVIGNGVKSIGNSAFEDSNNLSIVTIANSVTSIGRAAFYACDGLTSLTIPNSVTSIGWGAFGYCSSLTSVTIPNNVTNIESETFKYCSSLTSVTIGNSVTSIGDWAFVGCAALTSVAIPNSVTSIGGEAFAGCSGLISVTIPNSVTRIIYQTFRDCTGLTSVTNYATTPQTISSDVFGGVDISSCTLQVPAESVTAYKKATVWKDFGTIQAIGGETPCLIASGTCGGSLTWTLSCDSILTISGTGAMTDFNSTSDNPWYGHRTAIKSVAIGNGVTSIGSYAFYYCSGLTSVTIPNSVTSIGDYAFRNCSGLTSVTIGNSVTSIGEDAFSGCTGLTSVHISDIAAWCAISFYNFTANPLYHVHSLYVNEKLVTDLIVPENVTSIGKYAFNKCTCLTSVTIGNSVTSIGENAFFDCRGLTFVTIGNSVTSIGNFAFFGCTALRSVTNYATTPQAIEESVFVGVNLSSCTLHVPAESLAAYRTADVWKNFGTIQAIGGDTPCSSISGTCGGNLTWEISCDSVLTISGTGAMADFNSTSDNPWYEHRNAIKSVIIGDGITSIGKGAFYNCSVLTSVAIGNSVTSIEQGAFQNCIDLPSVVIPNSVTSIEYGAFKGCTVLKSITIGNSITSIGDYAFEYCSSLDSVTIPNSVTSIGYGAFGNCSGITSLTIGNSLTSIGNFAFYNCTGLMSVTNYAATPQTISSNVFGSVNISACTLQVSVESVTAYKAATVWKDFGTIQAIGGDSPCSPISGTCGGNLTWELSCDSVQTISGTGAMTAFNSASDIPWYGHRNAIKSVIIGDGITSIGKGAFYNCSVLTSVTIGNSVKSIEQGAFQNCSGLPSIVIPNSVTSIEYGAFKGCTVLSSVTMGNSIKSLGDYAFENCSSLNSVTIPNSVTSIGYGAFGNCSGLASVTIGNSLTSIGNFAFYNCSGLTSVTNYATTPQTIDEYVFGSVNISACSLHVPVGSVTAYKAASVWKDFGTIQAIGGDTPCTPISGTCGGNLTWELSCDSVLTISGTGAMTAFNSASDIPWYEYRDAIRSIVIGKGVTSIAGNAFQKCPNLTSVTIPNSVTSIGQVAFYECIALTSVKIPGSVKSIGMGAFTYCSSLTSITIPNSVTSIGQAAFGYCTGLKSVTIGSGITSIEHGLFGNCTSLTSVTIPNNVTSIGQVAFIGCTSLTSVTIPNSVTSIGMGAFSNCSTLTSVTIPNGITSIEQETFGNCSSLASIVIPNGVTSIGDWAFQNCTALTSVEIPNSVTSISDEVFSGCTALRSVTNYATTPQTIDEYVFDNVNISACTLHVPAESVTTYKKATVWKNFGIIQAIGGDTPCTPISGTCGANLTWELSCDSVLTISGTGAMADFNSTSDNPWYAHRNAIKSVIIGNSVTSIGNYAFRNCTDLTSVTIPNSVTSIGNSAFDGCSHLDSVSISKLNYWLRITFQNPQANPLYYAHNLYVNGNKITQLDFSQDGIRIGDYTFYGYTGLTSISITTTAGGSVRIGNYAFSNCSNLQSITMSKLNGGGCTIGDYAFSNCSNLQNITMPELYGGGCTIGDYAFSNCANLSDISLPKLHPGANKIGEYVFMNCSGLISINLGEVNNIAKNIFLGCQNLVSITVSSSGPFPKYLTVDGVLFNGGKTAIILCPMGKVGNYTIPNTTTQITDSAFMGCIKLTSIAIPASDTIIGKDAFSKCSGLTSITCAAVTPPTCGTGCFTNVNKLIPLHVPAESVEAYKAADVWKEFWEITTIGAEGIEDVQSDLVQSTKILRNGQIFIQRGEKIYTITGQEIQSY